MINNDNGGGDMGADNSEVLLNCNDIKYMKGDLLFERSISL